MDQELKGIIDQLEQYIQKAHQSGNKYDFIDPAYELLAALKKMEHPLETAEAILMLIERSPEIDYGGPGPLGGFMESYYRKGYEEKLRESITRKPTVCTLHLLNRLINDPDDPNQSAYISQLMSITIDTCQPENIQEEAKANLVYLFHNLQTSDPVVTSQLAMAQKMIEMISDDYTQNRQVLLEKEPPVSTVMYQGILFKVINHRQAEALLPNITDLPGIDKLYDINQEWRFPTYFENGFFLLAEENVAIEKLELDYHMEGAEDITILGFIFLKNIEMRSHIIAFDTDGSPALVVLGNVECPNIHLFGNIHYLGGRVTTNILWAKYNHGELHLNGSFDARVVVADDMQVYIRKINNTPAMITIMGMNIYIKQEQGDEWVQAGSSHELKDVFLPEVLVADEDGNTLLNEAGEDSAFQRIKQNKPLLK